MRKLDERPAALNSFCSFLASISCLTVLTGVLGPLHLLVTLVCHLNIVYPNIRKYSSTFYRRIAMVILAYFGPMGKLKFNFSLSVSAQFDSLNEKTRKACNTGIILVI